MTGEPAAEKFDTIIIGGGCSGLTAAHHIKKHDRDARIVVLEAKDRLGGRICGGYLNTVCGHDSWDVGGQWVASSQPHVLKLLEEFGLETYEQDVSGKKILKLGQGDVIYYDDTTTYGLSLIGALDVYFGLKKYPDAEDDQALCLTNYPRVHHCISNDSRAVPRTPDPILIVVFESYCAMVPVDDPLQCLYADEWDKMTLAEGMDYVLWTSEAKKMLSVAVHVMFGVEPMQLSFFYFLYFCQQCGGIFQIIDTEKKGYAQEWKVQGGTFRIIEKLANAVGQENIKLSSPVTRIEQDEESVKVSLDSNQELIAERVIIAIPPNFKAKIHYSPPLPDAHRYLYERMPIGHLTKVIVTYPKRFWKELGLSGEAAHWPLYMGAEGYPACLSFDATSSSGSPALLLFVGGKRALDLGKMRWEDQRQSIINTLVLLFGNQSASPIDVKIKDWSKEPWNGGCPVSVMGPGGLTTYGCKALREPFHRIHWAGTEAASHWSGYIDGAVKSGIRAANEVLAHKHKNPAKEEADDSTRRIFQQQNSTFSSDRHHNLIFKRYVLVVSAAAVVAGILAHRFRIFWN